MAVSELFYQLMISPLEIFLEVIYGFVRNHSGNPGLSIFIMSLSMNILLLPLYRQADVVQTAERDKEKKMEPFIKHIKKTFRGEERYMMLQTYYKQNQYKPYYSLRGLLPLVLEVPFFIAAYHFLSTLRELNGSKLGPIRNLGSPDGLIVIGTITINVLPVLMTLINIVSSTVYTKGSSLKEKTTLYGMALMFLFLLYNSPSGLVFYWTLNNLFSLLKNLFNKLRNVRNIFNCLMLVISVGLFVFAVFFYQGSIRHKAFVTALAVMMGFSSVFLLLNNKGKFMIPVQEKTDYSMFLLGGGLLSALTGVLIPSAVVSSSPEEFIQAEDFYSPLWHIVFSTLCAVGTFVIWFGVFYFLSSKKKKRIFEVVIWIASGLAIVDYMFFGTRLGELSSTLAYVNDTSLPSGTVFSLISGQEKIGNLLILLILTGLLLILFKRKENFVKGIYFVLLAAVACMSIFNISRIQHAMPTIKRTVKEIQDKERAHFSLSRNGKNVVVLMLDRAIGSYIPYLFQENPKLAEQFSGFTYYPNTLSFGGHTNFAAPALFGGYEYTPEELNKRAKELLADKHNEALKVMPVLFQKEGYDVTVCDPPYAGYSWLPDLTIYDDYPKIHTYNTEQGQFVSISGEGPKVIAKQMTRLWKRNFFCYSIMKISPILIRPNLYQDGGYFLSEIPGTQKFNDLSHAEGINEGFLNSYSVLSSLPEMTSISNHGNNVLILQNAVTHITSLLEEPLYVPSDFIDNSAYDTEHKERFQYNGRKMDVSTVDHMAHYHVNMAALIKLGEWMDYLRENGVYDNTRIIIVSDHGYMLHQFEDLVFGASEDEDVMFYNPLLLVKDFNNTSFEIDNSFMTNADVPTLAFNDLIKNPVNPFTGKIINSSAKKGSELRIIISDDWKIEINNGKRFMPAKWYSVQDNIFDLNNWKKLGEW